MVDNISAKQMADSVRREYKLNAPTVDDVLMIIRSNGFDIIDYDNGVQNDAVGTLIEELSLHKYFEADVAFTYQQGEIRLVFIPETMTAEEKLYALAHELGHIVYKHLDNGKKEKNVIEEYEANEFAHYFLNPSGISQISYLIKRKKILFIAIIVIIVSTVLVIVVSQSNVKRDEYYGEYYISSGGEKYHKKDCYFIKDKDNIHRFTIEEYNSGKYEPCQVCQPE